MQEILKAAEAELEKLLKLYDEKTNRTHDALRHANAVHNFYSWRRSECAQALKNLREYLNSKLVLPEDTNTPPSETGNIDKTCSDVLHQEDVQ